MGFLPVRVKSHEVGYIYIVPEFVEAVRPANAEDTVCNVFLCSGNTIDVNAPSEYVVCALQGPRFNCPRYKPND